MLETTVTLFGILILIRYQPRDENYIEWRIIHKGEHTEEHQLLDELIKLHYGTHIERMLRERYYWHMESEARAHPPDEPPF